MKADRIIAPDKIHLVRLKTIQGAINNEGPSPDIEVKGYAYKSDAKIAINIVEKVIGIRLDVLMEGLAANREKLGLTARYTHELVFVVDNLEDFTDPAVEGKEPTVDPLILGTLLGIAYSTVRGILYTRTQGTPFASALLPVVDPKTFIKSAETPQPQEKINN
jgi:hypothetical protein